MTELGSVITAVLLPIVKWLNIILAYLTAIVRAFKAVFGFGSSSAEKASKSLGNMSVSAGGLSDNLGSATAKAKELKKTIAGFDELEILNGPEEDSGSGSGSVSPIGVSGGYDVGEYFDPEDWETPDLTEFQKKVENVLTNVKDKFQELIDALDKNTKTAEGLFDWKKILGIGALGATLANIGKWIWDTIAAIVDVYGLKGLFDGAIWKEIFEDTIVSDIALAIEKLISGIKGAFAGITKLFTPVTVALAALAAGFIWC